MFDIHFSDYILYAHLMFECKDYNSKCLLKNSESLDNLVKNADPNSTTGNQSHSPAGDGMQTSLF